MKVLSHRGYWKDVGEKNTLAAFNRSFSFGFGTETDIRDLAGELVISHDMPLGGEMAFLKFLELAHSSCGPGALPLALNIKADGLAEKISESIGAFNNLDCFVFDMAVPDTLSYFKMGVPVFVRMSEVETSPVWLEHAAGIWLDAFESEWYDADILGELLVSNKRVCIVSPELHGRAHQPLWNHIYALRDHPRLMICTDFPEDAKDYFECERKL